jgi:uncharacterized protein YukE
MPALDAMFPYVFLGIVVSYFTIVVVAFVFLMKLRERSIKDDSGVINQALRNDMLQYFRYEVSQLRESFQKDLTQVYNELHMQLMQDRESFATYLGQVVQELRDAKQDQINKLQEGLRDIPTVFVQSLEHSKKEILLNLNQKLELEYASLHTNYKNSMEGLVEGYRRDVNEAKQRVITQIEESMSGFAHGVLKEYVAEALSDQDHERIIMHALSRAREEGLFRGF